MSANAVVPGSARAWAAAIRPASLTLALSPVLLGAACGFYRGSTINGTVFIIALAAALLMQIITNLQNDVGYTQRGAEGVGQRIGLPRATAQGWLTAVQVRLALGALCAIAAGLGLALFTVRGWPVLAIGAASLLAALGYMGGPKPVAYTPLGEGVAFVFFGPVAVMGTDWLLTGTTGAVTLLTSCCPGCLTAAALAVNNHRDREHDLAVGRRTIAVIAGDAISRRLFRGLMLGPFVSLLMLGLLGYSWWAMMPLALCAPAFQLVKDFNRCPPGAASNVILFRTFRLALWFATLLSIGLVAGRLLA